MPDFTGFGLSLWDNLFSDSDFLGLSYINIREAFLKYILCINVICATLKTFCLIDGGLQLTRSTLIDVFRLRQINILFKIMTK